MTAARVSEPEENLAALLRWEKLPTPEREFRFCPPRRWRFDFAFLSAGLAVEVEGGTFMGGRHTRGAAFEADCEKYAEALVRGWRVLRVTPHMIDDGRALDYIRRALR